MLVRCGSLEDEVTLGESMAVDFARFVSGGEIRASDPLYTGSVTRLTNAGVAIRAWDFDGPVV